jgi:hypothetical protein
MARSGKLDQKNIEGLLVASILAWGHPIFLLSRGRGGRP